MFRKIILITVFLILCLNIFGEDEFDTDLIKVKYDQKSVQKAMLLSAIFPGAGQFYANKKSITTYIFPVIEIGLWVGYFSYNKKGNDKEEDYKEYADTYYSREHQIECQTDLQNSTYNPFYEDHFHLDDTNTQHYYEDIGKYDRYIFGWTDWYNIYALDGEGEFGPNWIFENNDDGNPWKWVGNEPVNPEYDLYQQNQNDYYSNQGLYSYYRSEYIKMRQDAEDFHNTANLLSFGIVANHILGALDALRVTKKYNLEYISDNNLKIKFAPIFVDNELSPAIFVSQGF